MPWPFSLRNILAAPATDTRLITEKNRQKITDRGYVLSHYHLFIDYRFFFVQPSIRSSAFLMFSTELANEKRR